jgi:hypothetical protein
MKCVYLCDRLIAIMNRAMSARVKMIAVMKSLEMIDATMRRSATMKEAKKIVPDSESANFVFIVDPVVSIYDLFEICNLSFYLFLNDIQIFSTGYN